MIKIIAIGNLLMCDDGIALKVIDAIKDRVKQLNSEIECIKAETDIDYALDNIQDGDYLYILDSTFLGVEHGQISQIPLEQFEKLYSDRYSVHSLNLVSLLKHYNQNVSGYIIGIEAAEVRIGLEISDQLIEKFDNICEKIISIVSRRK